MPSSSSFYHSTLKCLRNTFSKSSVPPNFTEKIIKDVLTDVGKIAIVSSVGDPDLNFVFQDELSMICSNDLLVTSSVGYPDDEFRFADEINDRLLDDSENIPPVKKDIKRSNKTLKKCIPVPFHSHRSLSKINGLARKHYINCRLAPTVIQSNRKMVFSVLKDKATLSCIRYATFGLECVSCNTIKYFRTNNLDVARTISHVLNSKDSKLTRHICENPGHCFSNGPVEVIKYKNKLDLRFAL